jgi:hypothetical protein
MQTPWLKPLLAALALFTLALPLDARSAAPCTPGQGLAFYPLATPFKYLDTAQGWTAYWPQSYPLSSGWGQRFDGHASTLPDNAQALVARITLSNYRGEWPECHWHDNPYFEGYLCDYEGEASTAERHPRLRISTAQPAPTVGAGVIRVGSGPARPTEQLVTLPLDANGSFVLTADSVFDTRVEIIGYYAPPGPGALYMHLLDTPGPIFDSFEFVTPGPHRLGRAINAGESVQVPVVGTWNVGIEFGGPFTYTVPSDARYLVGNAVAWMKWTLSTPDAEHRVSAFRPGDAVPQTGLSLTTWEGFGEGYEYLSALSNGAVTVHSTVQANVIFYASGYFSPRREDDGNGPGLLFYPRAHARKGAASISADVNGGARLYVPVYDQDPGFCGVAAAGRVRFEGTGDGWGQEFGIGTPGKPLPATGISTASVTNDEVTFVRRFGPNGGFETYTDTADRSGTTLYYQVDTFGLFSP